MPIGASVWSAFGATGRVVVMWGHVVSCWVKMAEILSKGLRLLEMGALNSCQSQARIVT